MVNSKTRPSSALNCSALVDDQLRNNKRMLISGHWHLAGASLRLLWCSVPSSVCCQAPDDPWIRSLLLAVARPRFVWPFSLDAGLLPGYDFLQLLVAARCMLHFLKSQASPEALDVEMSWTLAGWTLGSVPCASMHE